MRNISGQTIGGEVVLNTSEISGAIANYSDFGPTTTTIVGSDPDWLTGTVAIAALGLSDAIDGSTTSSVFYPGSASNPAAGSWYSMSTSAGYLLLELGAAASSTGFVPEATGTAPFGTGQFGIGSDYLVFTIETLTSDVADANGPGFTDPGLVPVIGSTDTICSCFTMVTSSSVGFTFVTEVNEPPSWPIMVLGLVMIGGWKMWPRRPRRLDFA